MMNLNLFNLIMMYMDLMMILILIIPSNLYKFHPLVLSLLLILYIIIMSFKLNFMNSTYWYSYIFFLIMIGGVMVLFMYFTSMASNQIFYFNLNYYIYMMMKIIMLMIFIYLMMKIDLMMNYVYYYYSEIENFKFLMLNNEIFIMKNLLMDFIMDLNLYMIMYLFFMMICVVIICNKIMIPMRQLIKF